MTTHVSTKLNDFTHPLKQNSEFTVVQKKSLFAVLRSMFGKTTLAAAGITTANANIVQQNIAGISFRVKKNKTYYIDGKLLVSTGATPGVAIGLSLAGSSAATANINYTYLAAASTVNQLVTSNALAANSTGVAAAVGRVDICGYFTPDTSGFLYVTMAQNTSNASNSSVLLGSKVAVTRIFG